MFWPYVWLAQRRVATRDHDSRSVHSQLLLAVTLVGLFLAQRQKQAAADQVPSDSLCDNTLPAASYQTFAFPADARLVRNRTADAVCGPGFFFLHYHSDEEPQLFATSQDVVHAGSVGATKWSATEDTTCRATCINPADDTLLCSTPKAEASLAKPRQQVAMADKVQCYCKLALEKSIQVHGFFAGIDAMISDQGTDTTDADMCKGYTELWISAQGFFVLAAIAVSTAVVQRCADTGTSLCFVQVPFTNMVVKVVIKLLAEFERHETYDIADVLDWGCPLSYHVARQPDWSLDQHQSQDFPAAIHEHRWVPAWLDATDGANSHLRHV